MSSYIVKYSNGSKISGTFKVPASKSISNRVLIINALAKAGAKLSNIASCDDTDVMVKALSQSPSLDKVETIDIGAAGTSMRFLTAYLSNTPGEWLITGTQRMKERPISILVDALRSVGAKIEYAENEGFPPLRIHGAQLEGGDIEIDGSVSSQYISALMMSAPYMKKGLSIKLLGNIASVPYILMTQSLMKTYGADVEFSGDLIRISSKKYDGIDYSAEGDWSGASYWYEICALTNTDKISLPYLFKDSLQGDSVVAKIFEPLGVATEYNQEGVLLTKSIRKVMDVYEFDFIKCPDLAQTIVATCLALDQKFKFSGLKSLKIKETDRIAALIREFGKLGFILTETGEGELAWLGEKKDATGESIDTYKDHRMAMAIAPTSAKLGELVINDPMVVTKSYPKFWDEIVKTGVYKVAE
ncbi:MAG: 3-phosphoshikimate 1-carboxyvinyltransferase [Paludibacteraceae bacterium]|nr:3-phosphoshikimate 1-carboxyvinyltransferase [Paludibacteraceae bacterium]